MSQREKNSKEALQKKRRCCNEAEAALKTFDQMSEEGLLTDEQMDEGSLVSKKFARKMWDCLPGKG